MNELSPIQLLRARSLWLHGWVGGLVGVLLFAIAFSGAMAIVSERLLHSWSNPDLAASKLTPEIWQGVIEDAMTRAEGDFDTLRVFLPGKLHDRYLSVLLSDGEGDAARELLYRPGTSEPAMTRSGGTGTLLADRIAGMSQVLQRLHTTLLMPEAPARFLLACAALAMFLVTLTGLVLQPSLLREMFSNPFHRRPIPLLRSVHKLIGAWVLLFLLFMSYSAIFFTVTLDYLMPPVAAVKYDFDLPALLDEFQPEVRASAVQGGAVAGPPVIAASVRDALATAGGGTLDALVVSRLGQADSALTVTTRAQSLDCRVAHVYATYSGEKIGRHCPIQGASGLLQNTVNAMVPLHTTHIGPAALGWLWFLFGLATALSIWLGLAYYAGRRQLRAKSRESRLSFERLGRLYNGLCGGLLCTTLALISVDLVLGAAGFEDREPLLSIALLAGVVICTAAAAVPREPLFSVRGALLAAAMLALLAPLAQLSVNGTTGITAVPAANLLFLGLAFGFLALCRFAAGFLPARPAPGSAVAKA